MIVQSVTEGNSIIPLFESSLSTFPLIYLLAYEYKTYLRVCSRLLYLTHAVESANCGQLTGHSFSAIESPLKHMPI